MEGGHFVCDCGGEPIMLALTLEGGYSEADLAPLMDALVQFRGVVDAAFLGRRVYKSGPLPEPDRAGMVRIRIAVAVNESEDAVAQAIPKNGEWKDVDYILDGLEGDQERRSIVEAWVPKPEAPVTVEGETDD